MQGYTKDICVGRGWGVGGHHPWGPILWQAQGSPHLVPAASTQLPTTSPAFRIPEGRW